MNLLLVLDAITKMHQINIETFKLQQKDQQLWV